MKPFKSVLFVLGLVGLTACVSTQAIFLNPGQDVFEPTNPADIRIYLDEKDIPGEFIKFAIIKAAGREGFTTEQKMLDKIRELAAEIGADAVFIEGIKDPSDLERAADRISGGWGIGERKGRAIAIKFKQTAS